MPNFRMKSEDADAITRYFARVATNSDLSFAAEPEIIAAKEHQLEGETLFEMSNCQSCHVVGKRKHREPTKEFYKKDQMDKIVQLTPDLEFARGRLRTDWARKLILDPQSILPEIKMPGLKLLDRDVVKIMTFIFTYPVDQAEWLKWAEEKRKEEENKSETFGDEFD
jgi:cbb3-type cytochrome oxidase cytochrome c subunit